MDRVDGSGHARLAEAGALLGLAVPSRTSWWPGPSCPWSALGAASWFALFEPF
jgi:hypothetical protein